MKKLLFLCLAAMCLALLGGCGGEPPYKLSYKVRERSKKMTENEHPVRSYTEIVFLVESTGGDSVLKGCDGLTHDNQDNVDRKMGGCFVPDNKEGGLWALKECDIPLPQGTPVEIDIDFGKEVHTYTPLYYTIRTDKGEFKLPVSREMRQKMIDDYQKAEEQVVKRRLGL